jgi:hypothetical protein
MSKIDWVSKLTSRKFWMAIIGFTTGLLTYLGVGVEKAEQIGSLILMAASIAAYIIGEGLTDAASAGGDFYEGDVYVGNDGEEEEKKEEE